MAVDDSQTRKRSGRRVTLIVAALLLSGALLSYTAAQWEAPTVDEPLHAAAGYLIRFNRDYRIDVEDPALFLLMSSLPNASSDLEIDANDPLMKAVLTNHTGQWDWVVKVMFRTPTPDGRAIYSGPDYINRARMIFVLISLILGALIARWAYLLGGAPAAVLATALFAFDPNFLAHGALVKNDVPISLLMLWLMYSLWKLGERATAWRIISIALACALAVNVKFSGLLFGPLLAVGLTIRAVIPKNWTVLRSELKTRSARLGFAVLICISVALFCWGSIWTVYGCRFSIAKDPAVRMDRKMFEDNFKAISLGVTDVSHISKEVYRAARVPVAAKVLFWLDDHRVLPDAWLYGLMYTYCSSLERDSFLLGRHSLTGWWYYFPLAMLFKTPLAVLGGMVVLVARSASQSWRARRVQVPSLSSICLWLPIIIYGVTAMQTNLNLGLRHILPLYPFIYILMASALAGWMKTAKRAARVIATIIVIGAAGETLVAWPHEISFFNLAAGGAEGGLRLLSDSNLDWGQDLPLLADWHQRHPAVPLYLAYFGSTDPHYYGIDYLNVPGGYPFSDEPIATKSVPGVMAISATYLQGVYADERFAIHLAYLRSQQPREVFGGTIYLYDWSPIDFDRFRTAQR